MRRARIERGAGDLPEEPGDKCDEQVTVRHAGASGDCSIENQHEEKRKRDMQVNERGSEATNEEQADEGRKMVRFEQDAPNTLNARILACGFEEKVLEISREEN